MLWHSTLLWFNQGLKAILSPHHKSYYKTKIPLDKKEIKSLE